MQLDNLLPSDKLKKKKSRPNDIEHLQSVIKSFSITVMFAITKSRNRNFTKVNLTLTLSESVCHNIEELLSLLKKNKLFESYSLLCSCLP